MAGGVGAHRELLLLKLSEHHLVVLLFQPEKFGALVLAVAG